AVVRCCRTWYPDWAGSVKQCPEREAPATAGRCHPRLEHGRRRRRPWAGQAGILRLQAGVSGGLMSAADVTETLSVAGREVTISNPDKVLFPKLGHTKLGLAQYYIAVAEGALRGAGGRPNMLVRFPNGVGGEH